MTLFENRAAPTMSLTDTSAVPKKHGWLPLLTVLFLISYGLMTMLIVEQGQTIESQRTLIRELFRDSTELSSMKTRSRLQAQLPSATTQDSLQQSPSIQAPSARHPSTQYPSTYPSTQAPNTQAPNTKAPSSQAGPQPRTPKAAATKKPQLRMPSKPASDLVDDVRTLITI